MRSNSPAFTKENVPNRLDRVRIVAKVARVIAGATPGVLVDNLVAAGRGDEAWEKRCERRESLMAINIGQYILKKEIGSPKYRVDTATVISDAAIRLSGTKDPSPILAKEM